MIHEGRSFEPLAATLGSLRRGLRTLDSHWNRVPETGYGRLSHCKGRLFSLLGTYVGPYEVLEKLGTGGMGEVFLCHDSRLHRKVALKCLTSDEPAEAHANVLREARAVARLTHPHIASVHDVLLQDGRAFIVMEYVEGESLRSRLSHSVAYGRPDHRHRAAACGGVVRRSCPRRHSSRS